MTNESFERFLVQHLADDGDGTVPADRIAAWVYEQSGEVRQRPRWLALIKEPPMRISSSLAVGSPMARVAAILLATLLLAMAIAGAGFAGSRLLAAEVVAVGPAAYVHGALVQVECCGEEVQTFDPDGNRLTLRDMASSGSVEMDDPRLAGTYTTTHNLDEFPVPDTSERVEIGWGKLRIENEDGAWSGTYATTYDSEEINATSLIQYELTGEGEYEGLSALLGETGNLATWPRFPVAGAIFTGPLPPR